MEPIPWYRGAMAGFPTKLLGQLTGALDYALIVAACIVAGIGYHSLILGADVPDLMQYVGAGNIVAALFVSGAASQGAFNPAKIVSRRFQVQSIIFFWSVALLSFASFLFLAKTRSRFLTRNHNDFRRAWIGPLAGFKPLGLCSP